MPCTNSKKVIFDHFQNRIIFQKDIPGLKYDLNQFPFWREVFCKNFSQDLNEIHEKSNSTLDVGNLYQKFQWCQKPSLLWPNQFNLDLTFDEIWYCHLKTREFNESVSENIYEEIKENDYDEVPDELPIPNQIPIPVPIPTAMPIPAPRMSKMSKIIQVTPREEVESIQGISQCGNFMMFPSLRFYMKSILGILKF